MSHFHNVQSLYVHWPFCPYKCHFCPFVAIAGQDHFMERYHHALTKEIIHFGNHTTLELPVNTLYIGGGTPSTYPDALLLDMFGTLRSTFDFHKSIEVTLEVNPGTVRPEQLALWKEVGINRLSIGVQSLNDKVLRTLNRIQVKEDVINVLNAAQDLFDNISIDLIVGLPEVTPEEWRAYLAYIVTWPIAHISVYFLTVHENTILYFKVTSNRTQLPDETMVVESYHWTCNFLKQHGFEQYEISSFARPGYRSRHNMTYWERRPFKGLGLGAWSFDGEHRIQNEKNLIRYIEGIEGEHTIELFREQLTKNQERLEKIMLGLRRPHGVALSLIMQDLSVMQQQQLQEKIEYLIQNSLIIQDEQYIKLTPAGLVVENEVVARLS